jgi:phospholipid/cholesterol/gamma-HCH transport system permease protein
MRATVVTQVAFERVDNTVLLVRLAGEWRLSHAIASSDDVEKALRSHPPVRRVAFDAQRLGDWDSSILTFVEMVSEAARQRGISVDRNGLPPGIRRLLDLAEAVPERQGARQDASKASLLERVGTNTISAARSAEATLSFVGEMAITFVRFFGKKARYRASDLFLLIQQAGPQALPIVTLISFLVGVILAFIGAIEFKQFGAQIYVANLVGAAMLRELGSMMTAILMAGRTGAAYAAQLGTMKVTQEIDAYSTAGFPPLEFLVLPRVVALVVMMPLLCLYADVVGIAGGAAIGVSMLDFSWRGYLAQTVHAVTLTDLVGGLLKSAVYGVLVALAGCLRGLQSGYSSSAVGDAATSAVVTGIVAIIVADGIFAVVFYVLGI